MSLSLADAVFPTTGGSLPMCAETTLSVPSVLVVLILELNPHEGGTGDTV